MIIASKTNNTIYKESDVMTLNAEQEKMVGKAFMTAMARKLYREGQIDTIVYNRLVQKIEKLQEIGKKK